MTNDAMSVGVVRRRLLDRRRQVMKRGVNDFEEESELLADREVEFEDLAGNQSMASLLDRFGERERVELARIDAALGRLEAGYYGRCESCGQKITVDRLLALPETHLCEECQEANEPASLMP
jgi:RNA polymerase-binding protein DksA